MGCRSQNEEMVENGKGLRTVPPQKEEPAEEVTFFVDLTVKIL